MGGAVSSGRDNNELIDNLMGGGYIRTHTVESVFRVLDRADYMVPADRGQAYKDLAWRNGALHLSAPCIYSEVMEALELQPGQSFLNLGSGTGYLSTLAGLIIGSSGTSHGVEAHSGVVEYCNKKLSQFLENSVTLDEFDFCIPKYYCGNALCLAPLHAPYDRAYVGAGVLPKYENYFKQLIKVNGVLVMPLGETLVQIKRVSETEWTSRPLLNVSFALLRAPLKEEAAEPLKLDEVSPSPLMMLARARVRRAMLAGVCRRHPELRPPPPRRAPAPRARPRRICIPLDPESDVEHLDPIHDLEDEDGGREMNALLSLVLSMGGDRVGGSLRFGLRPPREVLIDEMENASSDGEGAVDRTYRTRAEALIDETFANVNNALVSIQAVTVEQEPYRPSGAGAANAASNMDDPDTPGSAVPDNTGVTRGNGNVDDIDGEVTVETRPGDNGPVENPAGRVEVDTEDVPLRPATSDNSDNKQDSSESDSKPSTSGDTGLFPPARGAPSASGSGSGSKKQGGPGGGGGGGGGGAGAGGRRRRRVLACRTRRARSSRAKRCLPQVSIYFGNAGEYNQEDVVDCSELAEDESTRASEDVQMEHSSSEDEAPSCSKDTKRQKLDSGIGDATPSCSTSGDSSPSKSESKTDESDSKTGESHTDASTTESPPNGRSSRRRRSAAAGGYDSGAESPAARAARRTRRVNRDARRVRLSTVMKRGVKELPLPFALKLYVNLGRCFEF